MLKRWLAIAINDRGIWVKRLPDILKAMNNESNAYDRIKNLLKP